MPPTQAGYKYLRTYQLAIVIYDLTVVFCNQNISPKSRTHDQMVQAARSGKQNIAEGHQETSLKSYIKLLGVARASFVELLEDFLDYARQHKLSVWPKEDPRTKSLREIRVIWDIDNPHIPDLPDHPESTVNLLITLLYQETYLLHKQIAALEEKFIKEGGYTEKLFHKRLSYRSRP